MALIYHVANPLDWAQTLQQSKDYDAAIVPEGFIHCCTCPQLKGVLARHFPDALNLILLCLDEKRIKAEIRYENLSGGRAQFPHIYGSINLDAVIRTVRISSDPVDRKFNVPKTQIDWPVFDGHNDTLLHLHLPERGRGRSFFQDSGIGHIDRPRAIQGGFCGGFFAMFTPTPSEWNKDQIEHNGETVDISKAIDHVVARRNVDAMFLLAEDLEKKSPDDFRRVYSVDDILDAFQKNSIAAIMHIEGAEAIKEDLSNLELYYEKGLRSLGPVWSRSNVFAHGVPFVFKQTPDIGPGLTDAGKNLVQACNELGIMIDLSHLNEKGFWDVAKFSNKPLVATHSAVHAITPKARNLTDDQLLAIRDSGGVVGVNFYVGDLRADGEYKSDMPLSQLIKHIEYIIDKIGIHHVAFGSDFDGALMSDELKDITGYPKILELLRKSKIDEDNLAKLCYQNWLRVLNETWKEKSNKIQNPLKRRVLIVELDK